MMYLYDSSGDDITSDADNDCGGDDCYDYDICDNDLRETFTMSGLDAGEYVIVLRAFGHNHDGEYTVSTYCADDIAGETTPNCNFVLFEDTPWNSTLYAVEEAHRYPIGGCYGVEDSNNASSSYSYAFLCNDDEVEITHYFGSAECSDSDAWITYSENVDGMFPNKHLSLSDLTRLLYTYLLCMTRHGVVV